MFCIGQEAAPPTGTWIRPSDSCPRRRQLVFLELRWSKRDPKFHLPMDIKQIEHSETILNLNMTKIYDNSNCKGKSHLHILNFIVLAAELRPFKDAVWPSTPTPAMQRPTSGESRLWNFEQQWGTEVIELYEDLLYNFTVELFPVLLNTFVSDLKHPKTLKKWRRCYFSEWRLGGQRLPLTMWIMWYCWRDFRALAFSWDMPTWTNPKSDLSVGLDEDPWDSIVVHQVCWEFVNSMCSITVSIWWSCGGWKTQLSSPLQQVKGTDAILAQVRRAADDWRGEAVFHAIQVKSRSGPDLVCWIWFSTILWRTMVTPRYK